MTRTAIAGYGIALLAACATALAADDAAIATKRASDFVTNVYTGQPMKAEEWLTPNAAKAPMFLAFGGIDAMIRQSTKLANDYSGLKSVTVQKVTKEGKGYVVVAEVKFNRDHRDLSSQAVWEHEPIIWELHLIKTGGVWKQWK